MGGTPGTSGAAETARRSANRRADVLVLVRTLCTSTGLVVAYYLMPLDHPFSGDTGAALALGLLGIVLLLVWQTRAIMQSDRPRLRAIESLLTTIPLFLLLFSTIFYSLERTNPQSFSEPMTRTDALYFTVTVFSTVGFGDITARSETARIVTTCQMIGDLLLLGVAARVLVTAVQEGLRRQAAAEEERQEGESGGPDPPGP
ncbi:potassium channel family protein [Kitasatospora sp. NPDC059571]|uniref:potassium channel family protein n=1 Tax=Kitasatospora sp. NPDC059571 TaxID=3346871 RepID=UPI0036CABC97